MLSNELIVNVATFMQSVGSAYSKQLQILFAPEAIPMRLKHVLDKLEIYRYISYDAEKDLYTFMGCGEDNAMLAKDKLLALWPIVSMESTRINEVIFMNGTTQFMVIASDNSCYDFTVIHSEQDARTAAMRWKMNMWDGIHDDVIHTAIIFRESDMALCKGAQFDYCCILNARTGDCNYLEMQ